MGTSSGRWKSAALLLIGVETAALFWAYYAFDLGSWLRRLESDGTVLRVLGTVPIAARALLPQSLVNAVASLVSASGIAEPLRGLALQTTSLGLGASASSWASAVVAPAYFAARRLLHHRGSRTGRTRMARGGEETSSRTRKLLEPFVPASTAVQEAL